MELGINQLTEYLASESHQLIISYDADLKCKISLGNLKSIGQGCLIPGEKITDYLSQLPIQIAELAEDTIKGHSFEVTFKLDENDYLLRSNPISEVEKLGMISITDITTSFIQWNKDQDQLLEKKRSQLVHNFIRDVSHEFRTPVTSMKVDLYLLSRDQDEAKRRTRIEKIDDLANEVINLVDDLKAMATVDFSNTSDVTQIDLNSVVQVAYQLIQSQYADNCATIRLNIDKNVGNIYGNKDELIRAFTEIMSNAVRFTPASGAVTVTTSFEKRELTITIEDNGYGMSEETLKSAFLTFQRGDEAHTTRGLGLGLPITKRIIEKYGGKIHIKSELHVGTIVTIVFPRQY